MTQRVWSHGTGQEWRNSKKWASVAADYVARRTRSREDYRARKAATHGLPFDQLAMQDTWLAYEIGRRERRRHVDKVRHATPWQKEYERQRNASGDRLEYFRIYNKTRRGKT